MEYEQGKVYLKNIHTGVIYLYERYMAHNKNYVAVVPNPVDMTSQTQTTPVEVNDMSKIEQDITALKNDINTLQTASIQAPGSVQ